MSSFANILVIISIIIIAPILYMKSLQRSKLWSATVTPLASIIGSGFLVSSALLVLTTGKWAPLTMLVIVTVAYYLGSAIRFNIVHLEPILRNAALKKSPYRKIESLSKPILGIAYVISVAFYLKLFSIFLLRGIGVENLFLENSLTSAVLVIIGALNLYKGTSILEFLEKHSVNAKLIVIFALIIASLFYNTTALIDGSWAFSEHITDTAWFSFRKILGILMIVQGFETSRYLGNMYSKKVRVKSMRLSQQISGIIYVVFVATSMTLFTSIETVTETVIIDLCKVVASILPPLLIFAALLSQFSAALADSLGSSGLISEGTKGFITNKQGVILTICIAMILVWSTNIYAIIVVASKAFAVYYALQSLMAARLAKKSKSWWRCYIYLAAFVLMLLVITLSIPAK